MKTSPQVAASWPASVRRRPPRREREPRGPFRGRRRSSSAQTMAATRRQRYAEAMAQASRQRPDRPRRRAFYALAAARHDRRAVSSATVDATKAQPVARGQPGTDAGRRHPRHGSWPRTRGTPAHSTTCCTTTTTRARAAGPRRRADVRQGRAGVEPRPAHAGAHLSAARAVGRAAPSDRAAFAASEAWVERQGLAAGLAQLPRAFVAAIRAAAARTVQEAAGLIDEMVTVVKATGELSLLERPRIDACPLRHRDPQWDGWRTRKTSATSTSCSRSAFSAARSKNPPLAELARRARRPGTAPEEGDLRPAIAIMEREVAGLIALAAGRRERRCEILSAAARDELAAAAAGRPAQPGQTRAGTPWRSLVGIAAPADALQPSAGTSAQRQPNFVSAWIGPSRARPSGTSTWLARSIAAVLANYDRADADLPELNEARATLVPRRRRRYGPLAAPVPCRWHRRSDWSGCPGVRHSPMARNRRSTRGRQGVASNRR